MCFSLYRHELPVKLTSIPLNVSVNVLKWQICHCCGQCSVLCSLTDHPSQVKKAAFNNDNRNKESRPSETNKMETMGFLFVKAQVLIVKEAVIQS
jgi:Na+-translocating ferredoxin:NAD+ oxidoreductase RnfC subunit